MIIRRKPTNTTIELEIEDKLITRLELLSEFLNVKTEELIINALESVVDEIERKLNTRKSI